MALIGSLKIIKSFKISITCLMSKMTTMTIFDDVYAFYVSYVHTFPSQLRPWPFHWPRTDSSPDFFLCTGSPELLDKHLAVDEYFLVDNRDLEVGIPYKYRLVL